jgi:RNA polymerase sigma-70 factor (ECF subfamily)
VLSARDSTDARAREALSELFRNYWLALYAYVRRRGHDPDEAADLVQGYFAQLIDKRFLNSVRPESGRFRAFLLHTLKHYLANERSRETARKRGGGRATLAFDPLELERRYSEAIVDHRTPESEYDRLWALSVVDRVRRRLERDAERGGRLDEFEALQEFLIESERGAYTKVAEALEMSPGAVRTAVHRLRRRFGQFLREEIADTVSDAEHVDDEIRNLLAALGRG